MKLGYTVSKEKGGQWYCHQVGFPYVPVFGSFGDKKKALHVAAEMCGLPYKEFDRAIRKYQSVLFTHTADMYASKVKDI